MDISARQAAVDALLALALSPDWSDRRDAGVALASFLGPAKVADRLRELVLDREDTAVTQETVAALVRRRDAASLAIVADALEEADDDTRYAIDDGTREGLGIADWAWAEAVAACGELPESPGRQSLAELLSWPGSKPD